MKMFVLLFYVVLLLPYGSMAQPSEEMEDSEDGDQRDAPLDNMTDAVIDPIEAKAFAKRASGANRDHDADAPGGRTPEKNVRQKLRDNKMRKKKPLVKTKEPSTMQKLLDQSARSEYTARLKAPKQQKHEVQEKPWQRDGVHETFEEVESGQNLEQAPRTQAQMQSQQVPEMATQVVNDIMPSIEQLQHIKQEQLQEMDSLQLVKLLSVLHGASSKVMNTLQQKLEVPPLGSTGSSMFTWVLLLFSLAVLVLILLVQLQIMSGLRLRLAAQECATRLATAVQKLFDKMGYDEVGKEFAARLARWWKPTDAREKAYGEVQLPNTYGAPTIPPSEQGHGTYAVKESVDPAHGPYARKPVGSSGSHDNASGFDGLDMLKKEMQAVKDWQTTNTGMSSGMPAVASGVTHPDRGTTNPRPPPPRQGPVSSVQGGIPGTVTSNVELDDFNKLLGMK